MDDLAPGRATDQKSIPTVAKSAKGAARANIPAAATIAEDLRQRFPGRNSRAVQTEAETAQG